MVGKVEKDRSFFSAGGQTNELLQFKGKINTCPVTFQPISRMAAGEALEGFRSTDEAIAGLLNL